MGIDALWAKEHDLRTRLAFSPLIPAWDETAKEYSNVLKAIADYDEQTS